MSIYYLLIHQLWMSVAQAEDTNTTYTQKSQITDITTQTVPHKTFRISPFKQTYGLTDKLQIGTNALLPLLGGASLSAKAQVYERKHRKFSIERQWTYFSFGQDDSARHLLVQPTLVTMGRPRKSRLFFYSQYQHLLIKARGDFSLDEFQQGITELVGEPIQLPPDIGATVSTNLVIHTLSFTTEWQRKTNKTILLYGQYSLWANGYVIGGVQHQTDLGVLDTGAGAYLRSPLYTVAPLAIVMAHQWDWERFHLRVGLPITSGPNVLLLLPKTFSMGWTI